MERFCPYLTKSNNGFPIVFSNFVQKGSGFFFFKLGSYFFYQMACIYLSRGGPWSLDFVITTYSYPLPLKYKFAWDFTVTISSHGNQMNISILYNPVYRRQLPSFSKQYYCAVNSGIYQKFLIKLWAHPFPGTIQVVHLLPHQSQS